MFNKFVSAKLLGTGTIRTPMAKKVSEILFQRNLKEANTSLNNGDAIKKSSGEHNNDQVRYAYNKTVGQTQQMYKAGQLNGIVGDKNHPDHKDKWDDFAFEMRMESKYGARDAMTDRKAAKKLDDKDIAEFGVPRPTIEDHKKKQAGKGKEGTSIGDSAGRTNKKYNDEYGLHQKIIYNDDKGNPHPTPSGRPIYEHPMPSLNALHSTESEKIAVKSEGPRPPDMLNKEKIEGPGNGGGPGM